MSLSPSGWWAAPQTQIFAPSRMESLSQWPCHWFIWVGQVKGIANRVWGGEDVCTCERKATWFWLWNCLLLIVWLHQVSAPLWPQFPICTMGWRNSGPKQHLPGSTLTVCEHCFRGVSWASDAPWCWVGMIIGAGLSWTRGVWVVCVWVGVGAPGLIQGTAKLRGCVTPT